MAEDYGEECDECYNPDFCEAHGFCIHELDINKIEEINNG